MLSALAPIVSSVGHVARAGIGMLESRDSNIHDEQMAVHGSYQGEFAARTRRTLWDSFVDGLNRLVRPGVTIALGYLVFIMPWQHQEQFARIMISYQFVPDPLWVLVGLVFTFWFGGRTVEGLTSRRWIGKVAEARVSTSRGRIGDDMPGVTVQTSEPEPEAAATSPKARQTIIQWWRSRGT